MSRPTRGPQALSTRTGLSPAMARLSRRFRFLTSRATGLVRVRSPLLTESRLMSFPPGTEMFQFPGFASAAYGFSGGYLLAEWVAPFGDPRIKACSRLPKAFRSVPRPSSPLGAKASTRCPCFPRPPPATTARPAPRDLRSRGAPPIGAPRRRKTGRRRSGPRCRKLIPATTTKPGCPPAPEAARRQHTHARCAPCPQTEGPRERQNARLADARHARRTAHGSLHAPCPRTGTSSPPHDVQTASSQPRPREAAAGKRGSLPGRPGHSQAHDGRRASKPAASWWAWADLNGRPHAYQACALTS